MAEPLTSAARRELRARAQRLDASVKLGRSGVTDTWLQALEKELALHQLVKVRFTDQKEERKRLAPEIAARTGSELVTLLGNVAVFFRANTALPDAA